MTVPIVAARVSASFLAPAAQRVLTGRLL